jgi:GDPmannose 4,6-dehydratase
MAFAEVGVELEFSGKDENEIATVKSTSNADYSFKVGDVVMKIDPTYYRPTEVELLIGDNTKAKTKLGWTPKYDLPMLVKEMMAADMELFRKEKLVKG